MSTRTGGATRIHVDRVACSAHGVCQSILPEQIRLDEWGYPIVDSDVVDPANAQTAVTWCPARALWLTVDP